MISLVRLAADFLDEVRMLKRGERTTLLWIAGIGLACVVVIMVLAHFVRPPCQNLALYDALVGKPSVCPPFMPASAAG